MSRIKGRIVMLTEIDIECEVDKNMRPIDEIQQDIQNGQLLNEFKLMVSGMFTEDDGATVKVTQQYAEINEVNDESETENAE